MNLRKNCSCCKKPVTTKSSYSIGRNEMGLWINCKSCQSTLLLTSYEDKVTYLLKLFEDYRKNAKKVS